MGVRAWLEGSCRPRFQSGFSPWQAWSMAGLDFSSLDFSFAICNEVIVSICIKHVFIWFWCFDIWGLWLWRNCLSQFSSVQFSRSVVSDSLWPHESQHARPPCPSPTPGVQFLELARGWLADTPFLYKPANPDSVPPTTSLMDSHICLDHKYPALTAPGQLDTGPRTH